MRADNEVIQAVEQRDTPGQGLEALRLAAIFQACLGAAMAGLGLLALVEVAQLPAYRIDLEGSIFGLYFLIGFAAMAIALPLAKRVQWAWSASWLLLGALLFLPFLQMTLVYRSTGGLHGSECSSLLLFLEVPGTLIVGWLLWRGRSARHSPGR